MQTDTIGASVVSSAFTINQAKPAFSVPAFTPIQALNEIYERAENDFTTLQEGRHEGEDDCDKVVRERTGSQRWSVAKDIGNLILLERPESAPDVLTVLEWLHLVLERIDSEFSEHSPQAKDAEAALVAIENLSVILPAMIGTEPHKASGFALKRFQLRYFPVATEREG